MNLALQLIANCYKCGMRMYVLVHITSIQFAGSPQVLAETVATITNNFMNFEPSDVSVTATLIGSLTQDAVKDSEVIVLLVHVYYITQ